MSDPAPVPSSSKRLGVWGWFAITMLLAFLLVAIVYAIHAWNVVDATVSPLGWFFMAMGIVFTIAVGGGLMALVFYSSRNGRDF
jgi:hypothetical protein